MSGPLIEIKDLYFSYQRNPVLQGVNLSIEQGDFVALLGPNGGGKSTLLKILAGILKADAGEALVMGRPLPAPSGAIGYVPQNVTASPSFPVSVLETVLMGRLSGKSWSFNRKDREAASRALERVGLSKLEDKLVSRLSGGQRQRVYLARALAGDPEILLLDEPTASVDQTWQVGVFDLLRELNQSKTILLASHDIGVISSNVKSVACVNQQVHLHPAPEITADMLEKTYRCPVELLAHGLPHRVVARHHDMEKH